MTSGDLTRTYEFQALTPIWTGDAYTAETKKADRLITTGLLGSIRWWFEVLIRGLGGSACDPSADRKPCQGRDHCVVCELFGCTGWARKFRFDVLDAQGNIQQAQITAEQQQRFSLRFVPLRKIASEEWALIELTLRLISNFGAVGGKTILKPTDERHREREEHHRDYGLVALRQSIPSACNRELIADHIKKFAKQDVGRGGWASLKNFWAVEGHYLARQSQTESSFNRVLGRHESKLCRDCEQAHNPPDKCSTTRRHPRRYSEQLVNTSYKWTAGGQSESKKVFSFKISKRSFGFVKKAEDFASVRGNLEHIWNRTSSRDVWFVSGDAVLECLFATKEAEQ